MPSRAPTARARCSSSWAAPRNLAAGTAACRPFPQSRSLQRRQGEAVGQPITVTTRPGASPSVRLFDLNRSLTGMEIERYHSVEGTTGDRPPDVLARRLFDLGATQVTIYSSVVTVEAPPERWAELEPKITEAIEHLFGYYGDDAGWSPAALEALGIEGKAPPEPQK